MKAMIYAKFALIGALIGLPSQAFTEEALPEHVLRAAYLYNFAQLTEWPNTQSNTIRYCFYRASDYLPEIEILKTKTIGNRMISIHQIDNAEAAHGCDALVIGGQDRYPTDQLISIVANHPVLTIMSERAPFKTDATIIQLASENNHLEFAVNLTAAKAAGLILSSRLLRVAKKVVQD